MPHPPVIVITGPTASGKGRLAVELARHFSQPVISLDSMKVYRGMDIGTAKPSRQLVAELPVHLIDLREPWEPFSVGDYLRELEGLRPTLGRPWIISGGTAFYLHALISGINPGPPPQDPLRMQLAEEAQRQGTHALHARLESLDPAAAASLHPTDLRRIIRALEVIEVTGELMSVQQLRKQPLFPEGSFLLLGIQRTREDLYDRIDRRVDDMFAKGWVPEVEQLMANHSPPWGKEASQSIGYRLIRSALENQRDPVLEIPTIQNRTHRFARSQITWFRKMPVQWFPPGDLPSIVEFVEKWLDR